MSSTTVSQAITSRFSARAFLPTPIPESVIAEMLGTARFAPSGTNTQPWKVYVLQGESLRRVSDAVCAAFDRVAENPALSKDYTPDYDYYPATWTEPFLARRRENGWGLYGLLGIGRTERDKMRQQMRRNFTFFDAPVGLMVTMSRSMGRGSIMDCGMFLQNIMLLAREQGLDTCPQAAWVDYAQVVRPLIGAGADEMLLCGMALGYRDQFALVNSFKAGRIPTQEFVSWLK